MNARLVSLHVCTLLFALFLREKAIIHLCNCCFWFVSDNQRGCANAVSNTQSHPQTKLSLSPSLLLSVSLFLSLRAAMAHLPFGFGLYCLTSFFYLLNFLLLSLLFFVLPYPPTLSRPNACPPAGQRVQKAAKIKKKAVCNKQSNMKRLQPLPSTLTYAFSFHLCLFLSLSICGFVCSFH